MQLVILGTEDQRKELGIGNEAEGNVVWVKEFSELSAHKDADAFMDLLFEPSVHRISFLRSVLPRRVIINSVVHTLMETDLNFIRINGWNGFLSSETIEASGNEKERKETESFLALIGKKPEWLPDDPGFVTPRVISMIINEAFLALEEGVSTREEIDLAMKLGTNYPYGPFEWAERIGIENVFQLLQVLARGNRRYAPAQMMQKSLAGSFMQ